MYKKIGDVQKERIRDLETALQDRGTGRGRGRSSRRWSGGRPCKCTGMVPVGAPGWCRVPMCQEALRTNQECTVRVPRGVGFPLFRELSSFSFIQPIKYFCHFHDRSRPRRPRGATPFRTALPLPCIIPEPTIWAEGPAWSCTGFWAVAGGEAGGGESLSTSRSGRATYSNPQPVLNFPTQHDRQSCSACRKSCPRRGNSGKGSRRPGPHCTNRKANMEATTVCQERSKDLHLTNEFLVQENVQQKAARRMFTLSK